MNSTIAILFGIWFVSEVIETIKKYKKEKEDKFILETLREEIQRLNKKNQELEKDNVFLKSMVNDICDELKENG